MIPLDDSALWRFCRGMRVAAQQCVQIGRALQPLVAPETKAPDSPHQTSTTVTLADRLLQEILILRAIELMPNLRVYSEELAACPDELRALFADSAGRCEVVLDPIDGSDDYAAGRDTWGVMAGLLDVATGQMLAAIIHLADHTTWCAARGEGVRYAEGLAAELAPAARPSAPRTLVRMKRLTGTDYGVAEAIGVEIVDAASRSCAVELARLFQGEIGAVAMRHFHGHDSAMGALIAQELGGAALDQDGEPIRFSADMPRLPLVVISPDAALSRELVGALAKGGRP